MSREDPSGRGAEVLRRAVLFCAGLCCVLLVPAYTPAYRLLVVYGGFQLIMCAVHPITARIKIGGFYLPAHCTTALTYVFPLMLAIPPMLIPGVVLLALVFIKTAMPQLYILRSLQRSYMRSGAALVCVPYVVVLEEKTRVRRPPRLFLLWCQVLIRKEGHRYRGKTETARLHGEVERVMPILAEPSPELARLGDDILAAAKGATGWRRLGIILRHTPNAFGKIIQWQRDVSFRVKNPAVIIYIMQARHKDAGFISFVFRHSSAVLSVQHKPRLTLTQKASALKAVAAMEDGTTAGVLEDKGADTSTPASFIASSTGLAPSETTIRAVYQAHAVAGPWYNITRSDVAETGSLVGYTTVCVPALRSVPNSARRLADLLASTVLPTAASDSRLPPHLRVLSRAICERGLAPVADAYFRFRLSSSALERFLSLGDCFEVLIKYCYFTLDGLLAGRQAAPRFKELIPQANKGLKPALGHWAAFLTRTVKAAGACGVESRIVDFWMSPITSAPLQCKKCCSDIGIARRGDFSGLELSWLDWLDWLVWLRNRTKGHGGIAESTAMLLWHEFHMAVLEAAIGLKEVVLESSLYARARAGQLALKQGLCRGPSRVSSLQAGNMAEACKGGTVLRRRGGDIDLKTYVLFDKDSCLTWNSETSGEVEYIDYRVGALRKITLDPDERKRRARRGVPAVHSTIGETKRTYKNGMPAVCNLPRPKAVFIGRADVLDTLSDWSGVGPSSRLTCVSGQDGVGKTELAIQYGYRFMERYDTVWLLSARESSTLSAGYGALACALNLPEKDMPEQAVVTDAVRRWLAGHDRWLLIFDNVDDSEAVRRMLPLEAAKGHIITTARNPVFGDTARQVLLAPLSRGDSIALLEKRSGLEDAAADSVAEALGDLPIALELAGSYCEQTATRLSEYLGILNWDDGVRLYREQCVERTVAVVLKASLDRASAISPASGALMTLCAFLGPDGIPIELIRNSAQNLPDELRGATESALSLVTAIWELQRFSLIWREGEMLSTHSLIQVMTRKHLADGERQEWMERVLVALGEALPPFPDASFDATVAATYERLMPHILATIGYVEETGVALDTAAVLLNMCGIYRCMRADLAGAQAAYERALALVKRVERAGGGADLATDVIVSNLNDVRQGLEELASAQAAYDQAVALGATLAPDACNLGIAYFRLGEYRRAIEYLTQSLSSAREVGEREGEVFVLRNLGFAYFRLGEYRRAIEYLEQGLAVAREIGEREEEADTLVQLGDALAAAGDSEKAIICMKKADEILDAIGRPDTDLISEQVDRSCDPEKPR